MGLFNGHRLIKRRTPAVAGIGPRLAAAVVLVAAVLPLSAPAAAGASAPVSWRGQYFPNATLTGTPAVTRDDAAIAFDWGAGSPDPALPADGFSVRWTKTVPVAAGTYRLTTLTDDGVRVTVDGALKIDQWHDQGPTQYRVDLSLTSGDHTIVVEYYENAGGAYAKVDLLPIETIPAGSWKGEYFDDNTFTRQPIMIRADAAIDFDWGGGGPAPDFQSDHFAVRWTRTISLAAGTWAFSATVDDGVRLFVDGQLLIDKWIAQSATTYTAQANLAAGDHAIRMEYFENQGGAVASLTWGQSGGNDAIRIDAGGNGAIDHFGNAWSADQSFVGGVTTSVPQSIANTSDDALYITERANNFSYHVPVANGTYVVRLHFAELVQNSSGVRQFDVKVEGTTALTHFDIYAVAGKASLITTTLNASVGDGFLDVAFANVFDNAVVQAIDVYPSGTTNDLAHPVFDAIPEPENATHTTPPAVSLSISDNASLKDGYWRIDDSAPQPLFSGLGAPRYTGQFTMPVETFNKLSLGSHVLSFGATDASGNAWAQRWAFRKLDSGAGNVPIAFNRRVLAGTSTAGLSTLHHPTSMVFGPDGRLYVAQQDGYIFALTLNASRNVTAVTRINSIHDTPTTNEDGTIATGVTGRHLMGIDFDPTSTVERPIIWAAHSDPRFCFGKTPSTCPTNTSSGTLTRLVGPSFDGAGARTDFVTKLPRSRELHAPNAVHFGPDGWLYLTIGSNTNYGAASSAFSMLPERYLTATMVRINVNKAPSGSFPIDSSTITGPSSEKPGIFETYATGYRNAFDFVFHSNGALYLNGNAGNLSSGNTPASADGCPNGVSIDPGNRSDYLAIVERGDHGGHPNPTRNQCILDDGSMYPTPLPADANYRKPILYYSNGTSSDGMTEYTAPTFGGQLLGNIISATFAGNQAVRRVVLSADGRSAVFEENLGTFNQPLDVAVGPDGSLYVAEYGGDDVVILEPNPPLRGSWNVKAPLPTPTQEVGAVACNGLMYVLGGLTAPNTDTNAVWAYDPSTNAWTSRAPYPGSGVDHPGAACVNGKVYLIGGLMGAWTPVATVYEYNPATNAWTQKASLPKARGAMGVAVLNGKIYAAGGATTNDTTLADLTVYDPAANAWQTLAPMPTAREHFSMEAVGGALYAIGGRAGDFNNVLAVNQRYDPATNTWVTRAPMPTARAAMATGTLNGHIQVWGGEGPSGTPTGTYPQGQDFDPKTNTWITIADELTPRHGTDGVTIGDTIYVPGGGPQAGSSVTGENDAFAFVDSAAGGTCIAAGSDPTKTDSDGDGYTDRDESDNGTNPCSSASVPADNDADRVSDLNDADDDNDGIPDASDQFQLDPANGTATALPWAYQWNPGDPAAGKFANSGFPGVQLTSNGAGFIGPNVHVGGAAGFMTVDATAGTARGSANSQDDALQVGFDARSAAIVRTRLADPFSGQTMEAGKTGGIFFGLDEDNYVLLGVASDHGGGKSGLVFAVETAGQYVANPTATPDLAMPGPETVDLRLALDPGAKRITAQYRVDSDDPTPWTTIGSVDATAYPGVGSFFKLGAAAGVMSTKGTTASFGLAYDFFRIDAGTVTSGLSISTSSLPDATTGQSYSTTLQATGGTTPYTWSVSSGTLPAGLSLNASTGAISGTPTTAGTATFTVAVSDSASPAQTATKSLSIKVAAPLVISTSSLASGAVGQAYSATLQATGGATPYSWSISSGALPAGLSLNASTGAISGTPTTAGTATFTARVTDSGSPTRQATKSLSITVSSGALSITTSSLPSATVGQAYSTTLQAAGGTTPYAWSVSSGTLPAGLSLNASTGAISGTPTTSGTSTFTVSVTDSSSPAQTAQRQLSIAVQATPPSALSITTTSLASGTVGVSYSATLTATGGRTPYTWSVSGGSLPPGLTLNASSGVISGTPSKQGSYSVTVRVVDSSTPALSATRTFSIRVTKR